jgi:hypothetical protein
LLDAVIGNYLDGLTEREFDGPFMALLRAHGYTDIHFMHGAYEFGKDLIAKHIESGVTKQYAFQTKAGDIGLADYRVIRGQIDDLRRNSLGHPNYDAAAPRVAVLVTTGRLTGAAGPTAQADQGDLERRGEGSFVVWDRERLIELLRDVPEAGYPQGSEGRFLGLVAAVDDGQATETDIETYARRWCLPIGGLAGLRRASIECGILSSRLRRAARGDLAAFTALCLVRGAWASSAQQMPAEDEAVLAADAGRSLFNYEVELLLHQITEESFDPRGFLGQLGAGMIYLAYPVACLRLLELASLYALGQSGDAASSALTFVARFAGGQPGATHPVSDRWAVSVLLTTLALLRTDRNGAEAYVDRVATWAIEMHDGDRMGLAGSRADIATEASMYLLAGVSSRKQRRNSSYLLAVLADVAAIAGFDDLYQAIVNDIAYVEVFPEVIETQDDPQQHLVQGDGLVRATARYPATLASRGSWKVAGHHQRSPGSYFLNRAGRDWDHLATMVVVRDRHFLPSVAAVASTPAATGAAQADAPPHRDEGPLESPGPQLA